LWSFAGSDDAKDKAVSAALTTTLFACEDQFVRGLSKFEFIVSRRRCFHASLDQRSRYVWAISVFDTDFH
jgi:hypothetical protein